MNNDVLDRYKLAGQLHKGDKLVRNDTVLTNWIVDSPCLWYKRATSNGMEFRLVDPVAASNEPAFEHETLATALASATNTAVDPQNLPLKEVTITLSPLEVRFTAFGKHWQFNSDTATCDEIEDVQQGRQSPFNADQPMFMPRMLPEDQQVLNAPDGKLGAFIRDHNVWIRDLTSGEERALTEDGSHDFSYSSSRCLGIDTAVQALWSPDSQRLFTIQWDIREVEARAYTTYVPQDASLRPQEVQQKQSRPFDAHIDTYQLAVIDLRTGKKQPADYPAIPLTQSGVFTDGFFRAQMGWWSPDNRHAYFVDVGRGAKAVRVVKWDTQTGHTQVLFEETSETFVRLSSETLEPLIFLPLPDSEELVWYSERSGWAHLYLYDLKTGELKHPITEGEWPVRDVLHYDSERRELIVQTAARDPDISPYYRDICKVNIDTAVITPLVYGNFEYVVNLHSSPKVISSIMMEEESGEVNGISPDGQYIVTTRSRVDMAPVTVLIDREGLEILELETADITAFPKGWQWPEPVKLKGADGEADIYGVVFRPPGFSADKSYPVVEYNNASRCFSGFPQGSFCNSQQDGFVYYFAGAIAALGFIVVTIDGRGTPLRGKAFADHHYGDFGHTSNFTDRIAGIRQLAERYPYMDLDRVGITSPEHPVNSVYALLKHSDFYKVCVQHCLTDPRFSVYLWEQVSGTVDPAVMNAETYPEHFVDTFAGKLLLIVGMISTTAADSTFRLVEALQKANKNFDMLCMPNMHHEMTGYTTRREWDYLVTHLQGIEPPQDFGLK